MAAVHVRGGESGRATTVDRLSWQDYANLVIEAPDTPMHMAVLLIADGRSFIGREPSFILEQAREYVGARLDVLPELREVLRRVSPFGGRPVWADDVDFDISRHVLHARVPSPGGDAELLATTARLLDTLLDRSRPLWELWVLTGLERHKLAILLKVHHAVTDGAGMVRIARALFDTEPHPSTSPGSPWSPARAPSWGRVALASAAGAGRTAWRAFARLFHPVRLAASTAGLFTTFGSVTARTWSGRRAAALQRPISAGRKLAVIRLDLGTVKKVAHSHGAKVNDVVLGLAASGLTDALHARGQSVEGVVLRALVAVSPIDQAAGTGPRRNRAGAVVVSLPLDLSAHDDQLAVISSESRRARRWQRAGTAEQLMVLVARTHLGRFLSRHQRAVELAVSNLRGPEVPIYFIGCKIVDAIPFTPISGNVTVDCCAVSYAGKFNISVLADATSWKDLHVLVHGMWEEWARLSRHERHVAA